MARKKKRSNRHKNDFSNAEVRNLRQPERVLERQKRRFITNVREKRSRQPQRVDFRATLSRYRDRFEPDRPLFESSDRRFQRPLYDDHPQGPEATTARTELRETTRKGRPYKNLVNRQGFPNPRLVSVCRKRTERRQALFAQGKAGKGKRGPKVKKLTKYSEVRC